MRAILLAVYLSIFVGLPAIAQEVVYLIRHAEKELSGNDPSITEQGRARAGAWAEVLQYVGLDVVFTSDAKRTQQTGQIIADKLGLSLNSVNRTDTAFPVGTVSIPADKLHVHVELPIGVVNRRAVT